MESVARKGIVRLRDFLELFSLIIGFGGMSTLAGTSFRAGRVYLSRGKFQINSCKLGNDSIDNFVRNT